MDLPIILFDDILPSAIAETILRLDHLDLAEREVNSVTKEERKELVQTMKDLRFNITGTLGFDNAVIADGGVSPTAGATTCVSASLRRKRRRSPRAPLNSSN